MMTQEQFDEFSISYIKDPRPMLGVSSLMDDWLVLTAKLKEQELQLEVQSKNCQKFSTELCELEERLKVAEEALVKIEELEPIHERERRVLAREALTKLRVRKEGK